MKSSIVRFRHPFFGLALATSLVATAAAADDAKKAAPPVPVARGPVISIDFPGGSIAQLLATVNKDGGTSFNLIGEKEDLATELPPFSVRNVAPFAFAMALKQLLEPRGLTVMVEQNDMFVLRRLSTLRGLEPQRFESFQLESYLEKQSIDDIVAAIRLAWELNSQNKPDALQLKFHPPTKLLLASGSGEAIMVASKVISTLPKARVETAAQMERLQAVAEETMKRGQERRKITEDWEKARSKEVPTAPPAKEKK